MKQALYVSSIGSLYYDGSTSGAQPELKPLVQAHCRGKYRRIDRFTQLALIGAARCAGDWTLPVGTPLYLASGKGPAGNNIEMQHAIVAQREPAKPIQFINAVSNSVSFYVMQDNQLSGQNLFVSREQHSFEAALTLVNLDMEANRADVALLGMVDELTHPLADQCARLGVAPDTALGEGSHWFLLHAEQTRQSIGVIDEHQLFIELPALYRWLETLDLNCEVFFTPQVDNDIKQRCLASVSAGSVERSHAESLWDGLSAGAIAEFMRSSQLPTLVTISCDTENRFHAVRCRRL